MGTTAGSGNNTTTLIAVDSDAFEDFNTELDLGTYWAVRAGADTELITNRGERLRIVAESNRGRIPPRSGASPFHFVAGRRR